MNEQLSFYHPAHQFTMRRRTAALLVCLLVVSSSPLLCTAKKLLETLSFDIKPSGQITHQTIKLVSYIAR